MILRMGCGEYVGIAGGGSLPTLAEGSSCEHVNHMISLERAKLANFNQCPLTPVYSSLTSPRQPI